MNADMLRSKFARLGARLRLEEMGIGAMSSDRRRAGQPLTVDVRPDPSGQRQSDHEVFDIRLRPGVELSVLDLRRRERHLLLRAVERGREHLFLCGHDEFHWFVAGVPGTSQQVTHVGAAMEALKPAEVLEAQRRQGIKGKMLQSRKNAAYVRQGEWFFLPMPKLHINKKAILHNEPLSRGAGSKPHWAEFLYRKGGEAVYVCDQHPDGLTVPQYLNLVATNRRAKKWSWRRMQRNAEAYVRGKVCHEDHKTIHLFVWHKVLMNTEGQSQAMRHVVFLD
jgi:hypothetical protein